MELRKKDIQEFLRSIFEELTGHVFCVSKQNNLVRIEDDSLVVDFDFDTIKVNSKEATDEELKRVFIAIDILRDEYAEQLRNLLRADCTLSYTVKVMRAIQAAEKTGHTSIYSVSTDEVDLQSVADALTDGGYRVETHGRTLFVRW